MSQRMERVKNHLLKNKNAYLAGGAGFLLAGITCTIVRSNIARGAMDVDRSRGELINIASFAFRSPHTVNVTTVLDREGRGHPGWPCRNLETKRIFFSQKEAALAFEIPENVLSGHLHGKFSDVDGLHFERVNLVEA